MEVHGRRSVGFTLVEILVVVSIIAILAGVLLMNFSTSSASGRDAKRQADLRMLQNAIELYKNKHGWYPAGCASDTGGGWSGQLGTDFECDDDTGQYIVGLAPEFIRVLPVDPRSVSGQQGYVYTTNSDGSVYKIMAMNVVESEVVRPDHKFARCKVGVNSDGIIPGNVDARLMTGGWCGIEGTTNFVIAVCDPDSIGFQSTYALWGGFTQETIRRLSTTRYSDITGGQCRSDYGLDPISVLRLDSAGMPISYSNINQWKTCVNTITGSTKAIICQ